MMRLECYVHDFLYLETEIRFFFFCLSELEKYREIERNWKQDIGDVEVVGDHRVKDSLSLDPDGCGSFRIRFRGPLFP